MSTESTHFRGSYLCRNCGVQSAFHGQFGECPKTDEELSANVARARKAQGKPDSEAKPECEYRGDGWGPCLTCGQPPSSDNHAVERVQPEPAKLKMGFLIRIEGHSDVVGNMFSPESLKMLLGELLEKQSGQMIQEGVDFDLEVNRTYEQR